MAKNVVSKAPKGGMLPPIKNPDQPRAPVKKNRYAGRRGVVKEDNRATGWRMPMIFCAGLIVIFAVVYGVQRLTEEKVIPIDPSLAAIASSWKLDVESDPEGFRVKEEMATQATGFKSTEAKDARLADMGRQALERERLDLACVATVFMHRTRHREELLQDIHYRAIRDCSTMPWSVFALRNLAETSGGRPIVNELITDLNNRWNACGRALGPNFHAGERLPGTGTGVDPAAQPATD